MEETTISLLSFYDRLQTESVRYSGPIEAGVYRVRVENVERTSSYHGMPEVVWSLRILGPDCVGGLLRKRHALTEMGSGWYNLRRDLELFGLKAEAVQALDHPQLQHYLRSCVLEVKVEDTVLGRTVVFLRGLGLACELQSRIPEEE